MKRTVFALGETLLDILFEHGQVLKSVPGGSVLNSAVSLGRMGVDVQLISEFGDDPPGKVIRAFLKDNGVADNWVCLYPENKTSIALAFLDENKNASYTFYHDTPEILSRNSVPEFSANDLLLFGSFYSLKKQRRSMVKEVIDSAKKSGALIFYDPNIRMNHLNSLEEFLPLIFENLSLASIVKGSDEDFFNIFGTRNPEETYEKVQPFCRHLLISQGSNDLILMTPGYKSTWKVPHIDPVSTVGAGDNLNAGLIYGIMSLGVTSANLDSLTPALWNKISVYGIEFAQATCLSEDNYVPVGFRPEIDMQA